MKQTNNYMDAMWVIKNPDKYDNRDVVKANSFIEAYNEGYNQALSLGAVLHSYLEKPKFRAIVLLPPLTLCVIGATVAFAHAYSIFGFAISCFAQWAFFGGAIWLLLSMWLVLWSDYKRVKNNFL